MIRIKAQPALEDARASCVTAEVFLVGFRFYSSLHTLYVIEDGRFSLKFQRVPHFNKQCGRFTNGVEIAPRILWDVWSSDVL